jgi:hypothetical protein
MELMEAQTRAAVAAGRAAWFSTPPAQAWTKWARARRALQQATGGVVWPPAAEGGGDDFASALAKTLAADGAAPRQGAELREELLGHMRRRPENYRHLGDLRRPLGGDDEEGVLPALQRAAQEYYKVDVRVARVCTRAEVRAAAAAGEGRGVDAADGNEWSSTAHMAKSGWRECATPAPPDGDAAVVCWVIRTGEAGAFTALATSPAGRRAALAAQRATPGSLLCPVAGCSSRELTSQSAWAQHFNLVHLAKGQAAGLDEFLRRSGRHMCGGCGRHTLAASVQAHAGCGNRGVRRGGVATRRRYVAAGAQAARRAAARAAARAALVLPTLAEVRATAVPTLQSVKANFRPAVSNLMANLLTTIADAGETGTYQSPWEDAVDDEGNGDAGGGPGDKDAAQAAAWRDLHFFVATVLRTQPTRRSGRRRRPVLDTALRERLAAWQRGDWRALWADALGAARATALARAGGHDAAAARRRLARKKFKQHQLSAAMRVLTSSGLHPEPLREAQAKYPPPDAPAPRAPMPAPEDLQHDEAAHARGVAEWRDMPGNELEGLVRKNLHKCKRKRGSAPGPSGLRFEHLTAPLLMPEEHDDTRDRYLTQLARVMRDVLCGDVPAEARADYADGQFTGLSKPDGGCRPIIVTEALARPAGNILFGHLRKEHPDELERMLGSSQMGAGCQGGRTRLPTQRNTSSRWRQHATRQGAGGGPTAPPRTAAATTRAATAPTGTASTIRGGCCCWTESTHSGSWIGRRWSTSSGVAAPPCTRTSACAMGPATASTSATPSWRPRGVSCKETA